MTGAAQYHPGHHPANLRAGDDEREAVAEMVRSALGEGRIDLDEVDDRLGAVYQAKTHGDLAAVIEDLVARPPATRQQHPIVRRPASAPPAMVSDRVILPAFLLCFFFGIFGAHRYYTGPAAQGALRTFLPFTGIGAPVAVIWWFADLIVLLIGQFKDGDGRVMRDWT